MVGDTEFGAALFRFDGELAEWLRVGGMARQIEFWPHDRWTVVLEILAERIHAGIDRLSPDLVAGDFLLAALLEFSKELEEWQSEADDMLRIGFWPAASWSPVRDFLVESQLLTAKKLLH